MARKHGRKRGEPFGFGPLVGHYSAVKRNEPLIHVTTWKNLKVLCYMKEDRIKLYVLLIPFM